MQTIICFAILAMAAVASCFVVRGVVDDDEQQLVAGESGEVAALLSASLAELHSALTVLASLAAPGDEAAFDTASASLVTGNVRAIGQVEIGADGSAVVVSSGGGDVPAGTTLDGERLNLIERARGGLDVVTAVIRLPDEVRVGYALQSPSSDRIVYREAATRSGQITNTVRGQVFDTVDFTLYASAGADPEQVLLSTTSRPVERGYSQSIAVGADQWLLITRGRDSITSNLIDASPWIVLTTGLAVAFLISALVETQARRRSYALALVEQRTVELKSALAEQSRLEAGQRAARQEAEAANQAKSVFLSRMSHELRTPLNGVLGFAQLLELDALDDRQSEAVRQILKGGWHLLDLINEVLDITRIETGSVTLSPEPVLASEVLTESLDLVRPLAERSEIHVLADRLPSCDVHVLADRQRVKQILLNLLSNAVKYNRRGGSVAVACATDGGMLRISVVDTGPGIRPEHLGMLFTPFERLGAEGGSVEGTGIGLALSQRLAEAMGGTIGVGTKLDTGSTFTLSLPVVEGPVERFVRLGPVVTAPVDAPLLPAVRKVLYIEDNLSNLRLVERLLENRPGVEIVAAMQGRLGLELARQHRPAAVLLDLHLPDVGGGEVLRQLREDPATASIPVVIVSADATPGQVTRLRAEGAYAYLTKPLDVAELLRLLDEILSGAPG